MLLKKWEDLPSYMKCDEVRTYYDILSSKKYSLILKRIFDVLVASVLLVILAIPMIIIAVMIKLDSPGPVFYRQERVTTYGKHFKIHKFRTMVSNADKIGTAVTVENDNRITRVGAKLRGLRLDELPQVLDVLSGDMSILGPRPLLPSYLPWYTERERHRHDVRPGLSGLAQVNGRNYLDWDKRFELDVQYTEKITFFYKDIDNKTITYPVFVKPARGSASIAISKVYDKESIVNLMVWKQL